MHRGRVVKDEADLIGLPSIHTSASQAAGHDACALIEREARDACPDRRHRDCLDVMLACDAKRRIH